MTVWLGTPATPQQWEVTVTGSEPRHFWSGAVHRGLGGGTQVVFVATPPEAGQTLTVRTPIADTAAFLDWLAAPQQVTITSDDPACPVATGAAVVTSSRTSWLYQLVPPVAETEVEVTWT